MSDHNANGHADPEPPAYLAIRRTRDGWVKFADADGDAGSIRLDVLCRLLHDRQAIDAADALCRNATIPYHLPDGGN